MDALELLTTRRSSKNLMAPAPDELQLDSILQAATQVPDHGNLRPWRFVVIQTGQGLQKLGGILRETVQSMNMGEEALAKAEKVATMAPMVIGVISKPSFEGPKRKPEWEQFLSAGCAAYAVQLAAKAQGFDNVWITGMWVNAPLLREAFGCGEKDKIVGLMMIGSPMCTPADEPKNTDVSEFTEIW